MRAVLGPVLRWLGGLTLAFAAVIGLQTFRAYLLARSSERQADQYEREVEAAGPSADSRRREHADFLRRSADNEAARVLEAAAGVGALVAGGVVLLIYGTMIDWHIRRRGPKGPPPEPLPPSDNP